MVLGQLGVFMQKNKVEHLPQNILKISLKCLRKLNVIDNLKTGLKIVKHLEEN